MKLLMVFDANKMDEKNGKMRQQNLFRLSQWEAFLSSGLFDKTNLQAVTCKFPKCISIYKWIYKCI
jgi:hypothetical protein